MQKRMLLLGAVAMVLPALAYTHGGPLDSHGCHPNVVHGSYHCHQGPLAERQYKSKEEMLADRTDQEREERTKQ